MPRTNHKFKRRKIRKNPAAMVSLILVILSGFLFPLYSAGLFGKIFSNKKLAIVPLIINIFSNGNIVSYTDSLFGIILLVLIFLFLVIILLYFLNGFGIIYNKYSRYASYLTFIYLIIGLVMYTLLNEKYSSSFLGFQLSSINLGVGIYFIPIVGVLYLLFRRTINSMIRI